MDLTWVKVPMTMIPSKFTHIKKKKPQKKKKKEKKTNGHDDPIKT
jgi:hypothetical protein